MLLYIAFLAYDSYAASHAKEGQVGFARGESSDNLDVEAQKITGIADTLIDELIKAAGTFVEDPEYSDIKDSAGKIVREL